MHDGNTSGSRLSVAGGLQPNEWQHFALTRSGTTCTLYRNGISEGSWTIAANADFTPASNPRYAIGNRLGLGFASYDITSYFQDFRVYVGTPKYYGNFNVVYGPQYPGSDSVVDSPTNGTQEDTGAGGEVSGNYATWSPVDLSDPAVVTLSDGNLKGSLNNGNKGIFGTIAVSSGKWYWEQTTEGYSTFVGIADASVPANTRGYGTSSALYYYGDNGQSYGTLGGVAGGTAIGASFVNPGATIGTALDMDNGTVSFYKDGAFQSTLTLTGIAGRAIVPAMDNGGGSSVSTNVLNCGQNPFAYPAPSGYKALCTANLPDPPIADGSRAMDTKLYTGTEATLTISGYNFAPDLVWRKGRQAAGGSISETPNNLLFDTVRGAGKRLISNDNSQEDTGSTTLTAFTSDGFTLGSSTDGNDAPQTYVAWAWDAGTSTVSNTDGSITSTVRANPSAGFSIVSYTGTGVGSSVGHGLNTLPAFMITKQRNATRDWFVQTTAIDGSADYLLLNTTDAKFNTTFSWSSTTFSVGGGPYDNASGGQYVAYCWTPVEGYSAFGSYTGNGSADGPFVYTGFRPAFVMYKRTDSTSDWYVDDYQRDGYNFANKNLYPNLSNAESSGSFIALLSNGFKLYNAGGARNAPGGTYIYAAFAENPFKYARAR
jgi:hypothetical protein